MLGINEQLLKTSGVDVYVLPSTKKLKKHHGGGWGGGGGGGGAGLKM